MVERVETWVEHPVLGDLHVDTTYSNYQDFGGLKVPGRIVQKQAGLQTFDATITSGDREPGQHRAAAAPPPPGRAAAARSARAGAAAAAAPPAVQSEKLADGVYRITGGYVALAVDMQDHVVVLEGGQNEARGLAVIAEAKQVIPNKPIRYVVNTHAHFDHASGLAPFAAEGITIITHDNNKDFLEKALGAPRTLVGDSPREGEPETEGRGRGRQRVLAGRRPHHRAAPREEPGAQRRHADRVPAEGEDSVHGRLQRPGGRAARAPAIATLVQNVERLKLDFDTHVLVHAPNPDRPQTKADLLNLAKGSTN